MISSRLWCEKVVSDWIHEIHFFSGLLMQSFVCNTKEQSIKLWSSELWTQFKQLRVEAGKSQDFNGVWTRDFAYLISKSAVQYMKHFIYHFTLRGKLSWIYKYNPAWRRFNNSMIKTPCLKWITLSFAGPNEIYRTQITANKNYSYWMKDGVQNESWTQNEQHPRVNSEMTRYQNFITGLAKDLQPLQCCWWILELVYAQKDGWHVFMKSARSMGGSY